jgi:benzoylformate decarboxylase
MTKFSPDLLATEQADLTTVRDRRIADGSRAVVVESHSDRPIVDDRVLHVDHARHSPAHQNGSRQKRLVCIFRQIREQLETRVGVGFARYGEETALARHLDEGAQLVAVTSDPAEAARAPIGEAIVADPQLVLRQLANAVAPSERPLPQPRLRLGPGTGRTVPLSPETVFDVLNEVKPDEAVIVNESTSNTESFSQRVGLDRARSFYFPAAGALGFGIPAAVGVQLAEPGRPVIGVIGDGSANYAITGLWSAAHYRVPATFVILRNDEYGVLKWFAGALKATGLPGMDLPGIDYCAIAQGYGVRAVRIASRDELAAALVRSVASDSPSLIEVPIRAVG